MSLSASYLGDSLRGVAGAVGRCVGAGVGEGPGRRAADVDARQALQYALDHYPTVRAALEQVECVHGQRERGESRLPAALRFASGRRTAPPPTTSSVSSCRSRSFPSISGPVLPSASGRVSGAAPLAGCSPGSPSTSVFAAPWCARRKRASARARAEEGLTRLAVQTCRRRRVSRRRQRAAGTVAADEADVQRREVLARAAHTLVDNQLRPGAEASRADAELAAARTRASRRGRR